MKTSKFNSSTLFSSFIGWVDKENLDTVTRYHVMWERRECRGMDEL